MTTFKRNQCQGLTAIELLVALAMLAVMLAFAAPKVEDSAARSALKETTDQVAQAFRQARIAARLSNSPVSVNIDQGRNQICFSLGEDGCCIASSEPTCTGKTALVLNGALPLDSIPLGEEISISGNLWSFSYSPLGSVNKTGVVLLASTVNPDFTTSVEIENLVGQVTTNYGLLE